MTTADSSVVISARRPSSALFISDLIEVIPDGIERKIASARKAPTLYCFIHFGKKQCRNHDLNLVRISHVCITDWLQINITGLKKDLSVHLNIVGLMGDLSV